MNIQNTLDAWLEANTQSTSAKFTSLVQELDYRNIEEFIDDNSGCFEQIADWIGRNGTEEWKEALTPALRDDIQQLLDRGIIELDEDQINVYVLTSTNYAVIARWDCNGYLVGSIEVCGDSIALYDENDKLIKDGDRCDYLEGFKHI